MQQKTIVSFGEILWDLLPTGRTLGGAPFNFVYRTDCLGERGIMISRLGRDELGREAFEKVRGLGMEIMCIQWDETHPTGTVRITFDEANNPDFVITPDVAYDYIEVTPELLEIAAAADCIYFGTLAQRTAQSREACRKILDAAGGSVKLLDINLRKGCYRTETLAESLGEADVLKLNEDEAGKLAETFGLPRADLEATVANLIEKYPLDCCVVTLGSRGAYAASSDGQRAYVPGYQVSVVDPLGAGDAFAAGFIHKYLRGASLAECCEYGNAMGAVVAAQEGATAPLSEQTVSDFLSAAPDRVRDAALVKFALE